MSKTILLTGGCGFIGSAVVRHLIRTTGHRVVNVDKMTYAASPDALEEAWSHPRHVHLKADITDPAAMRDAFATHQPDVVMHLAAESHVDRSIDGPGPFIQTNIVGTYVLLEAARAYRAGLAGGRQFAGTGVGVLGYRYARVPEFQEPLCAAGRLRIQVVHPRHTLSLRTEARAPAPLRKVHLLAEGSCEFLSWPPAWHCLPRV